MKEWIWKNHNLILAILWIVVVILHMVGSPQVRRDALFCLWGMLIWANFSVWFLNKV